MNRRAFHNISNLALGSGSSSARLASITSTARHLSKFRESSSGLRAGRQKRALAAIPNDDRFRPATTDEEWLKLDEKVNEYPCHRTFKAIGTGGKDFADSIVAAVERATSRSVDRRIQVVQRPSKEGKYTAVSVRSVNIDSGKQVLKVFREIKQSGGDRLKYII